MKKLCTIFFLFLTVFFTSGYKTLDTFEIKPERNAFFHNNLGLRYLEDKIYYEAIQEFKIAISLNPNTQATAVYYNNLGETYLQIGYPKYAQDCFERAIIQNPLNFKYYQNLAECFALLNLVDYELKVYSKDTKNPLNKIMVGLLLEEKGRIKDAIIILDEFCMSEPDLIITKSVEKYIDKLTDKLIN